MSPKPPARPATAPQDPTEALRGLLDLTDAGPDPVTGEPRFEGRTPAQVGPRVFGGQVLGQALAAASRTVPTARSAHSLHGYFIRPGDALQPITFTVETLRDGRSFSVRRVLASQNEKAILALTCSFQEPTGSALDHQVAMPEGVPRPEDLPTTADVLGGINHPVAQEWAWSRPFDIRHVTPAIYVDPAAETENRNMVWMKTFTPLADDPALHLAALTYASDYTLLEPILRQHGVAWIQPGMSVASLDHAMWFHRPARVDEWLLYVQDSPTAQGARGLGRGHVFTRDGELVATVAQEGMIRLPEGHAATAAKAKNVVQRAAMKTVLRRTWRG
ncbi:acyl-CoA thioesterase II [Micrococcus porci]|uniref:acyl-CoA thioesterase n=1 Tax=Micrococcus porci TaxID=2856555 RepID=UPI001CCA7783|nr:acyl-CoA thioesterase II [Micrococcus porci]UBH24091.1 acyl-CoA thioesterase II [Micrococcus porci]